MDYGIHVVLKNAEKSLTRWYGTVIRRHMIDGYIMVEWNNGRVLVHSEAHLQKITDEEYVRMVLENV